MAAFLLPWRITRYLHDVDTVVGSASRSIFLCSAAPCPAAEPSTASWWLFPPWKIPPAKSLMMDGELDGGRRSLDSQAVGDLMMDGELAGLPGFSARQGEQEVHGVGMAIGWGATRPLASWPGCSRRGKRRPPWLRRTGSLYRPDPA